MSERCIANESLGTTGFSYTLSLINGKYKMTILYTLMEFGVVRFNEMKNTVEKSPAKHCVRRSRSLDQTGWCTGRDIHRFLRRRNTA